MTLTLGDVYLLFLTWCFYSPSRPSLSLAYPSKNMFLSFLSFSVAFLFWGTQIQKKCFSRQVPIDMSKKPFCLPFDFVQSAILVNMFLGQSLSHIWLCDPMGCSTPGFRVHLQPLELLKLMSIESVIPSNHPVLCQPLLLLPSIFRKDWCQHKGLF